MSTVAAAPFTPYKGLAPFEDSDLDALLFFGRERETEIIVSNLLASKLTVLYGPSGVGKSSVLRAAVVRRLRDLEPEAQVLVLDEWAESPELPEVEGEAFLILDQFEEYFLYRADGGLADALAASHAHVLIAVREDQLARLDAFQARIPHVFANRLRLGHLDRTAARAAIVGPLDRWNAVVDEDHRVGIESALVDEVLEQVATSPDRIEAPYLQLVLERVWDEEHLAGSRVLRLETLERLGGAQAIVGAHLERALAALPQPDAEIATNALRFLVTPSRTKIAQTLDDLVGYTNESPVVLRPVLERVAAQRVLRAGDGGRYEIFHDVLAEPVLAWRRERESRAALAAAARRHRRLAILAGASLALAAAMIALTVYAFSQRSEAAKQRRNAERQTELALGQKQIAQQQAARMKVLRADALTQKQQAVAARRAAVASAETATEAARRAQINAERARNSEAQATSSALRASENEAAAKKSAAEARTSLQQAQRSRKFALAQKKLAQHRALVSRVGQLVATAAADLTVDPVRSVRAALDASTLERSSSRVEDALRDSLAALRVRAILAGGGGAVNSATFSHDGSLVATGAEQGAVRIYDARTHALLHAYKASSEANVVRFSPDDTQLAIGTAKNGLVLYDVRAGRAVRVLPHGGAVLDAAYAGRYLVTGGGDFVTRIWDPATGDLVHAVQATAAQSLLSVSPDGALVAVLSRGQAVARVYSVPGGDQVAAVNPPGEVTSLGFSPNGAYLVTTGRRNGFVWDTKTWTLLHTLSGHEAALTDVAFTPDGRVITSSIDSSARVWDPATGAFLFWLAGQHQQKVLAVAASPDDGEIATVSADETARIWQAASPGTVPIVLAGHRDSVTGALFDPTSSRLLTWSADGTARLWDTTAPSLSLLGTHAAAVTRVAFSPDGKTILSSGADGTAKLWRGSSALTLQHGGKVVRARFVADGSQVLTSGDDGTAKLWRAADGALLRTYTHGADVRAALPVVGGIVTVGADGVLRSWTTTGALRWTAQQGAPITAAAVSRDGTLATGSTDGVVRLWRPGDGKALRTLHGDAGSISSVAFDPAGTRLASAGNGSSTDLWDVGSGKLLHAVDGHPLGVTSVEFSPDGRLFLTAGVDGDARIWRTATGAQVHRLTFHVATVAQAAFSPDGRWVVTAGPTTAGIWQVRTGRLIEAVGGTKGNLAAAAWAPDSERLVVGTSAGVLNTFDCTLCRGPAALRAAAKARLAALR